MSFLVPTASPIQTTRKATPLASPPELNPFQGWCGAPGYASPVSHAQLNHLSTMQATTRPAPPQTRELTEQYFQTFNENQFDQTAALFTSKGQLIPPFDSPVVGEQAILAYLKKEAENITAYPERWESEAESDGEASLKENRAYIKVTGKVNAIVFKVNVAWYFILSDAETDAPKIESVRIKLLASPKELLGLRSAAS